MTRITVHIGHYGSGKTELSLNLMRDLLKQGEKAMLVDLDIVNPYFRSGEHKEALERLGGKVIRPNYEGTNVDVPSLPPDVSRAFIEKDTKVVLDVGGDPSGAKALGRYHQDIEDDDYVVKCVVNTARPFTKTSEDIVEMVRNLESSSKLKVDMLVNNTNVARETTAEMLVESQPIVEKAAEILGIKVGQIGAINETIEKLPKEFYEKYKEIIVPIELYMRKDWMD
ncbi:MAG: ATP-binding protein [Clostridia bacterium]|nr:ATP-binding protein [Clostridia bacterium]